GGQARGLEEGRGHVLSPGMTARPRETCKINFTTCFQTGRSRLSRLPKGCDLDKSRSLLPQKDQSRPAEGGSDQDLSSGARGRHGPGGCRDEGTSYRERHRTLGKLAALLQILFS